jgi:hypothetical protein
LRTKWLVEARLATNMNCHPSATCDAAAVPKLQVRVALFLQRSSKIVAPGPHWNQSREIDSLASHVCYWP